jgi:hypothetical protein
MALAIGAIITRIATLTNINTVVLRRLEQFRRVRRPQDDRLNSVGSILDIVTTTSKCRRQFLAEIRCSAFLVGSP